MFVALLYAIIANWAAAEYDIFFTFLFIVSSATAAYTSYEEG